MHLTPDWNVKMFSLRSGVTDEQLVPAMNMRQRTASCAAFSGRGGTVVRRATRLKVKGHEEHEPGYRARTGL